ncbi:Uncharacterized protein T05_13218, partial [Trichinella murrelli]
LDSENENVIRTCELCQQSRASPPHAPVHNNSVVSHTRDLAGPICGKNFLIVVDAFSKWLEVSALKNTTSESVISCLRQIFSIHGLLDIIVSDNGTQVVSNITSAPFHPYSNDQAEITGYAPFEMMFGRPPRLPVDAAFNTNLGNATTTSKYVEELAAHF